MKTGLPGTAVYEYQYFAPEEVHMAIAAKQLVIGMYDANSNPSQATDTLAMIPKNTMAALGAEMGTEGWGLHAVPGYSLFKVLAWIAVLTVLGLVFVVCWLTFVNKTDLQNAFIPAMFLSSMLLMALAIPQLLGIA